MRVLPEASSPYCLLRVVGADSIGLWFDAEQRQPRRSVTVKVLKPDLEDDPDARRAFSVEIDRLAPLPRHPDLYSVLDALRGDHLALVTEPLDEKTLAAAGPFRMDEVVRHARDVARALGHLAASGLAHRNVSPCSVRLAGEGGCRVVTLGDVVSFEELARLRGRLCQDTRYVAPEQVAGDLPIGPAAATYQVAALLFHMVTGRPPHVAPTPVAIAHAHFAKRFPSLDAAKPLARLVRAATRRDPAVRPQPAELAEQLDSILAARKFR